MPDTTSSAAERPSLSAALEAAVDRFERLITAIGRRHGLAAADVDEVVQDVRIRLWRNRGEQEALEAMGSSYVHRTAVSAALDLLRRRRAARTGVETTVMLQPHLALVRDDPANEAEQRELAARVYSCVERLMPSRRPVVRMHLAGYDRREIARVLRCTEGKVRNLLSRGLADLRALLTEQGVGPEGLR
ncbi:MAG: RNA polymerase sigma factor [Gemmatimonadales bacterium]